MFVKTQIEKKVMKINQIMIMNTFQMKVIYLNIKIDKRFFFTPVYCHNDIPLTQYYELENVSRMFTTCHNPFREICLSNDHLSAFKVHEKHLSFNEQDLLQTQSFRLAIAPPLSSAFKKFASLNCVKG